ncbi:MAG: hypothetical protein QOJ65_736 [Fimbriimonadaceae bacterium]|nr:hypothetical protein [Fimbriimonadaceae bacterium]
MREAIPAPPALTIIATRRSHRSTNDPAKGEASTPGSAVNKADNAKLVVEWVCWKIQTPIPKLVSPEPSVDTHWPNQIIRNVRKLRFSIVIISQEVWSH